MNSKIFEKYCSMLGTQEKIKLQKYDEKYFLNFFLKNFKKNKNLKILDIGCGWGKNLKILEKHGYTNSFGIDISTEQIEIAEKNDIKNVKCINAIDFLKNSKEKYDVILLIDVLEHIEFEESIELIKLINGSLNDDGTLYIQVPNAYSLFIPLRYSDLTHLRAYTYHSLTQLMNLSTFKKFNFYELYPFIHGIKSFIRFVLWKLFFKPLIYFFVYTAYGNNLGKIFSANILCIVRK
jgi:2-polyprenyl-3-methyl-5-hydroxy-6-metoxy-1,4-benzoquinol methylase